MGSKDNLKSFDKSSIGHIISTSARKKPDGLVSERQLQVGKHFDSG